MQLGLVVYDPGDVAQVVLVLGVRDELLLVVRGEALRVGGD